MVGSFRQDRRSAARSAGYHRLGPSFENQRKRDSPEKHPRIPEDIDRGPGGNPLEIGEDQDVPRFIGDDGFHHGLRVVDPIQRDPSARKPRTGGLQLLLARDGFRSRGNGRIEKALRPPPSTARTRRSSVALQRSSVCQAPRRSLTAETSPPSSVSTRNGGLRWSSGAAQAWERTRARSSAAEGSLVPGSIPPLVRGSLQERKGPRITPSLGSGPPSSPATSERR